MSKETKQNDDFIEKYLQLCHEVFEDMARNNSFPWKVDSDTLERFESRNPSSENISDNDAVDAENPYC